ncbi:serine/threonine protein kinase [Streptomyces sp. NPDC049916]|uniref:serine/threonine protein kinase n=1 Tax=Streptomyces sp. NPDC049916 TaxID=3155156 RepID=UPI00342CFC8F
MDDYAGRVLADRYRLPLPPSDGYELIVTRAFDTYSGQEVLVRQVPLPEIVDAEVLDADGLSPASGRTMGRAVRRSTDPAVRRAIEAAQAAAQVPDHPRLDQVFDVFAEAGSLWIVSELVAARPLSALLAERPLNPYRAAEIGSDVLTALRVLHAHGWTHRNITVHTVLVCDDGRVMLTGLAAGAAEEALCGYATAPLPDAEPDAEAGSHPGAGPEFGPPDEPVDELTGEPVDEPGGVPTAGPATRGVPAVEAAPPRYGGFGDAYALPPAGADEVRGDGRGPLVPPLPQGYAPQYPQGPYSARAPWEPHDHEPYETRELTERQETYAPRETYDGRQESQPSYESYEPYESDESPASYEPYESGESPDSYEPDGTDESSGAPAARPDTSNTPESPGSRQDRAPEAGQAIVPRPAAPAVPYAPVPPPAEPGAGSAAQLRAARAGAIAAYRAGARAAARVTEDRQQADRAPADLTKRPPAPGTEGAGSGSTSSTSGTGNDAPDAPAGADTGTATPTGTAPDAAPGPRSGGPWSRPAEAPYPYPYDDEDDEDEEEGPRPPGRRVHLAGTWDDGPGSGRSVPAGGSGADALRADSRRPGPPAPAPKPVGRTAALPAARTAPRAWEEAVAGGEPVVYRGPATPLAAERARQARIAVVGPVTERWAPEQAGPVYENWQLAPPIGPSTDLWALGALLYRAVQGHAPYPEENAAELVQMVCGEPPAFAEECGPLRPVVESLLRQDPTERPDFEELRGWLRSLVRSAPEPEAGVDVVTLPAADATRLPVVRRRGELVRRRRGRFGGGAAQGRHRQGKRQRPPKQRGAERDWQEALPPPERSVRRPVESWEEDRRRPARAPREPKGPRVLREPPRRDDGTSPRRLGRLLLVLIFLLMAAAIAYAVMFLPKSGEESGASGAPSGSASGPPAASGAPQPSPSAGESGGTGSQQPQTSRSAAALAPGYALRKDAEGFEVGVPKDWQRSPANADRQIRYGSDGFTLLVVPGRDTVKAAGDDPLAYQADEERELQAFRDSSWSTSTGVRRVDVGRQAMAEGQFTWLESGGREVYARNLAMIVKGRYHVIQVIGPANDSDRVTEIYEQAIASYRVNA